MARTASTNEGPPYRGPPYFPLIDLPTRMSTTQPTIADDGEGIRYVFYVTLGWLTVTVLAVAFLMLVVPSLM